MGFWKGTVESMVEGLEFYKGKRVLITGHTGFKGSWLSRILIKAEAEVVGYSLKKIASPNLYDICRLGQQMVSLEGDIRDLTTLQAVFCRYNPEIVFHLAAQPIVKASYENPVYTYETNVMGTVNVCECVRNSDSVRSFVNITTDKVYENKEWEWGYRENEPLDGFDPYSNSKSCSELVTHSYKRSYFDDMPVAVSTARAGNVIGGGDFAADRIIPDCVRAVAKEDKIVVRNPFSIRPYQHVLEPLNVYLTIAYKQYVNKDYEGYYNVGPNEMDCIETGKLVEKFCKYWGKEAQWITKAQNGPHEANYLKLDCSKVKKIFDWEPVWNIETAIEKTVDWYKLYLEHGDVNECMDNQISVFFSRLKEISKENSK